MLTLKIAEVEKYFPAKHKQPIVPGLFGSSHSFGSGQKMPPITLKTIIDASLTFCTKAETVIGRLVMESGAIWPHGSLPGTQALELCCYESLCWNSNKCQFFRIKFQNMPEKTIHKQKYQFPLICIEILRFCPSLLEIWCHRCKK